MKGVERWVACGDNHGDQVNPAVASAFFAFVRDFKPSVRIHGGDAFDLRCLRKNASQQETRDSPGDDIEAGITFLDKFKPTHFLRGNHDERLWDAAAADDGKLSAFASYAITEIEESLPKGCQVLPYDKVKGVLPYGDHNVVHGYNAGVYAARHAAMAYGNTLMFHVHADDEQSVPRFGGAKGHSSGCIAKTSQIYNRAHLGTLRQTNGWLYGLNVRGRLVVWHAKQIDGAWFLPSEIREVRGEG
jgi:hypothetical protein